jgi:hypothetical protein
MVAIGRLNACRICARNRASQIPALLYARVIVWPGFGV